MLKRLLTLPILATLAAAAACTVHQTAAPSLTGPSEFALSVSVTAQPDSINQDGGSQSSIRVVAHDASGQPVVGQTFRLDILVDGSQVDYGRLSARTIVTGADGTAVAVYTAPAPAPAGAAAGRCQTFNNPALAGQCVSIAATPIGSNFASSQTQTAEIRLMPPGVILPAGSVPVASFIVTPTPVIVNIPAVFDASSSCGAPLVDGACNQTGTFPATITSYAWTFGDGAIANGRTVSHTFSTPGTFTATLTVTNDSGLSSAPATQTITVTSPAAPSGNFVFSPSAPNVGDTVFFNADGILPAPGHTIVQMTWNFGDGATAAQTAQPTHVYAAAGTYTVVLSVADDSGQKKTFSQPVTVGTGVPTASFTFAATGSHAITTDGSASKPAGSATIATYAWSWGDGSSTAASAASVATHTYAAGLAGTTVTVTLTVTDSLGRVGSTSQSVTVP